MLKTGCHSWVSSWVNATQPLRPQPGRNDSVDRRTENRAHSTAQFMPAWMLVGLCVLMGLVGCGSDSPHVVPVKGKISYQGKPLTSGTVMLVPESSGYGATGQIQPDGTFTLTSFKQNDGAAPGKYKVTVEVFPEATPGAPASGLPGMEFGPDQKPPIPIEYSNVATTKLQALINDGPTELDFTLED